MNNILSDWFRRYLSHPEAGALLVVFVAMLAVFKLLGQVASPIIIGVIVAYLLHGMVKRLERLRLPHLLAVSVVFTIFMFAVFLFSIWLLPALWNEMLGLLEEIPRITSTIQGLLVTLQENFPDLISVGQMHQGVSQLGSYLTNFSKEMLAISISSLFGMVTLVVYFVLIPFLVFFFLRDGANIINWLMNFLPDKRRVLYDMLHELHGKIHSYIQGKIIEITLVTAVSMLAFWILGLRYAALLGALFGISVIVPYIGVVIVTVPIVLIGLIQWGWSEHLLYLVLVYSVITILDANLLVPLLFSEVMNLHPLAILLSVLVFGNIFGFWGVFFAIPLMTLMSIVVKSWPRQSD